MHSLPNSQFATMVSEYWEHYVCFHDAQSLDFHNKLDLSRAYLCYIDYEPAYLEHLYDRVFAVFAGSEIYIFECFE